MEDRDMNVLLGGPSRRSAKRDRSAEAGNGPDGMPGLGDALGAPLVARQSIMGPIAIPDREMRSLARRLESRWRTIIEGSRR
jgi:hypothetical protein